MAQSDDLYRVATRLDETPVELLNGGAADGLRALAASSDAITTVAAERGIEATTARALWDRADARLRDIPDQQALFPAAAEAAGLLYAAAWALGSASATTEDLQALL